MDSGLLNLLMNFGGPILLGAALVYGMIITIRRQRNPLSQARTDKATRELYDAEQEKEEQREERQG